MTPLFLLGLTFLSAQAFPPPPAFCNHTSCFLTNSYGSWNNQKLCRVTNISFPETEQELLDTVTYGMKHKLKMKVVSKLSHSIPPLACPGSGDKGLLISTSRYTSTILVNTSSMTILVDSGVQLQDLLDKAAKEGLALPASPYWNGLSIGGIISTGSHGSSWKGSSAVHDHVVSIRMVIPSSTSSAKVVELTERDGDRFSAALVSLGTLGVISKVTLKLETMFKRSVTLVKKPDTGLEDEILSLGKEHEFSDVTWYPSKMEAVYRVDHRVPVETPGDGVNNFIGFQPTLSALLVTQRALEEKAEATRSATSKCVASRLQVSLMQSVGYGLKNFKRGGFGMFTGYPVVGFQHRIQTSGGCQNSASKLLICGWDSSVNALFYHETGVTIPVDRIVDFLSDVKLLRDVNPESLCGLDLYTGILLRYVNKSRAILGKQFSGVDVGFTYYRARNGSEPRLYQDVVEEIEQMAVFKYGGVPHWGKNKVVLFSDRLRSLYRVSKFVSVMKEMDPEGLFSSAWSDHVLGIRRVVVETRGCALEGLCICSRDEDCAPEKGYFCRQGRVFSGAQVCRYVAAQDESFDNFD